MNSRLFPMMDVDDINDRNEGSHFENVASAVGDVFSMSEENRGLVERAPHIQFLGVCQRMSQLPGDFTLLIS